MNGITVLGSKQKSNRSKFLADCLPVLIFLVAPFAIYAEISISNGSISDHIRGKYYLVSGANIERIEAELRKTTGLNRITVNKNGVLSYDKNEKSTSGSEKMRRAILGAIDDQKNVFRIINVSRSRKIQFGVTDQGTTDVNSRITTYQIMIDFADFENSRKYTPEEVQKSFTVGIVIFHEIDHKASYDSRDPLPKSGIRPDISSRGIRGVIENTNAVRKELSLSLRDPKQYLGKIYYGHSPVFANTHQIEFQSATGKRKLFLRWRLENER